MENRIKELPLHVKNMIAAGEVVEGPFSAVKELIENAIDAHSRNISVEVEEAGFKRIAVRDDGSGIYKEDLPLAITEHATSKISDIDDINAILSYGFRGEALSSIASISQMTVLSRRTDEKIGGKLVSDNGRVSVTDYAGPVGTTVIIENLFYNTPARKKFLKTKQAESRTIREVFLKLAMSRHDITFTLDTKEKKPLTLHAVPTVRERAVQIFGGSIETDFYHDTIKDINITVSGFVSKPHFIKSNRSMQYLYVNSRPVDYKNLSYHLSRAYEGIALGGFPAAIIFIEIKPDLVDVNIHPAKREVKFFDTRYIDSMIYSLAKKVLGSYEHSAQPLLKEGAADAVQSARINEFEHTLPLYPGTVGQIYSGQSETIFVRESAAGSSHDGTRKTDSGDIRILGIIFGTYILAQKDDSLKIIDFHAAHERILYDKLSTSPELPETQELIFPEAVELPPAVFHNAAARIPELGEMGFDCEEFGENTILVRGIPSYIKSMNVKDFILDLAQTLPDEVNRNIREEIAARAACHSARRANDELSQAEIRELLSIVFSGSLELRCPHGRPFVFTIEQSDFEKLFKR